MLRMSCGSVGSALEARIELRRLVLVVAAGERVRSFSLLASSSSVAGVARVGQVVHAVDDRARAEEQAGLEAGVGDEVEQRRAQQAPTPTPMNMKPSCDTVE